MTDLYVMPFTAKSVLLYHHLQDQGHKVAGFFDNNPALRGLDYNNCLIKTPAYPLGSSNEACIVLCEPRYYRDNQSQLRDMGFQSIGKIEEWLPYEGAKRALSQINDAAFIHIAPRQANALKRLPWQIMNWFLPSHLDPTQSLIIDILDVIVTEKCSLKCKNCANLMQYFTTPKDMDMDQIYQDIDLIFSKADWIRSFYVFGGEVFMFKNLAPILRYITRYKDQYGLLCTITNGTLIPSASTLLAMKETGMGVYISDYGPNSYKLDGLIELLTQHAIPYQRFLPKWFAYQQLVDGEDRDPAIPFKTCQENCCTLIDGKLYRCPFLAHAETLSAVPYSEHNHLDIKRGHYTKADIKEYLAPPEKRTFPPPPGCAFCSGYDVGNMPEVPIAAQIKKPLPYRQY